MNPTPTTYTNSFTRGLNAISQAAGFGVLIESNQRIVRYANQNFCNLFNIKLPPHQLIGGDVLQNAKGFSGQFLQANAYYNFIINSALHQKESLNNSWQLRNGETILIDYIPHQPQKNSIEHIWIYKPNAKPFTQTIIEEFPQKLSANLENTLNQLAGPIAVFTPTGNFVFANKAYIPNSQKRLWAIGKTYHQYLVYNNQTQEAANTWQQHFNECIAQRKAITWEHQEEQMHQTNYYKRHFYPYLNINGEVEFVVEQGINISTQKKLTTQLANYEAYVKQLLNRLNDMVVQTDANLKIEFFNEAFANVTGYSLQEHTNQPMFDVLPINNYGLYKEVFEILNKDASHNSGKLQYTNQKGEQKILAYNLNPNFSVDEMATGIVATFTDVTMAQLQEQQLLELIKKEKELNELKTTFVNMVSHELRTPLTVISSSAEILDLMLDADLPKEEIKPHTKQIVEQVEKMTAFMQDLLMISKLEAGKIELNATPSDIVAILNDVIKEQFAPFKDGRNLQLTVARKPTLVQVDTKLIKHVLQNVLNNALKYSLAKQPPTLRVAFSKTYCTITVHDFGIGIPQQELPKLFTSFFRASNTGNISGTGIGLMVVKYFTEQHKGYVAVKSQQNKGTIFTLKIPYTH